MAASFLHFVLVCPIFLIIREAPSPSSQAPVMVHKRFAFLLVLLLLAAPGEAEETVTLDFAFQNTHNFPYQIGNGDTIHPDKPGIAVELVLATAKKLGIEIHLQRTPWKRGLLLLEDGEIDGLFNGSYKPERERHGAYPLRDGRVDPSRKSYSNAYALYTLRGSPLQWDGERITHLDGEIGAPLGFSIVDDLKRMGVPVQETRNTLNNMRKLLRGRIAAVAIYGLAGDSYLKRHPAEFKEIVKLEPPLSSKEYYLMLSHQLVKSRPDLAEAIWSTLAEIRDSEAFHTISEAYFE